MRALIVFDKFKDSLTARAACEAAEEVLRKRHPDWELDLCPLTDGGEGFTEILTTAAKGTFAKRRVTGPRGHMVEATWGRVPMAQLPPAARAQLQLPADTAPTDHVAVIEMAAASGLALLAQDERDPWQATSEGSGEL